MTDRDRYYDNVILKVLSGADYGFWPKLIDLIMGADDENFKKLTSQYRELMAAIDRYNKKHPNHIEKRLQRQKGK